MTISRGTKRRLAVTAFAIAALAVPFTSAGHATMSANRPPVRCQVGTSCGTLYYSDAGHTNLVGAQTTDCQGVLSTWGVQSGYSQYVESSC